MCLQSGIQEFLPQCVNQPVKKQSVAVTEPEAVAVPCATCAFTAEHHHPADAQQLVELQRLARAPRGFQIISPGCACGSKEAYNCSQPSVHPCLAWCAERMASLLFQLRFIAWASTAARHYVHQCRDHGSAGTMGLVLPPRCQEHTPGCRCLGSLW